MTAFLKIPVTEIPTAERLFTVIAKWQTFKRTHTLASEKVNCCKHTQALFDALDALEKDLTEPRE
jgi:hypothetical protein